MSADDDARSRTDEASQGRALRTRHARAWTYLVFAVLPLASLVALLAGWGFAGVLIAVALMLAARPWLFPEDGG